MLLAAGKKKKLETLMATFDSECKNAAKHFLDIQAKKESLDQRRVDLVGKLLQSEDVGLSDQIEKNKRELDDIERETSHLGDLRDGILRQLTASMMKVFDERKKHIGDEIAADKKSREDLAIEAGQALGRFLEIADRLRFGLGNNLTRTIKELTTESLAHMACQVANNSAAEKKEENLAYYNHWQDLQYINGAGPGDAERWAAKKARRAFSRACREQRAEAEK